MCGCLRVWVCVCAHVLGAESSSGGSAAFAAVAPDIVAARLSVPMVPQECELCALRAYALEAHACA